MSKKTFYAFIVSFILLITAIVLNRIAFDHMKSFTKWVDHTRDVITSFESISNNFKSAQIYTTTYTNDSLKIFYTLYKLEAEAINPELSYLKRLLKDDPEQSRRIDTLTININKHLPLLLQKNVAEIGRMGEGWRLKELFIIHETIYRSIEHERELLNQRSTELNKFTRLTNLLSIAFGIIAVSIFIFTFLSNLFISKKSKWLEGFLESILNTSRNGIIHIKGIREQGKVADFKIEFLNKAIDSLFGLHSITMTGKKLSEFPSYFGESAFMNSCVRVVETGHAVEFESLYKKGTMERWFLVSLAKLDDGVTVSFQDISQMKKLEEELRIKIHDLERSNTELEQYAYVASHDLQEPLRKIRSFGSYLKEIQADKLDEKGQQLLDKIMNSADRMSSLIKDILSFSSLKKQTGYVPVDLNETVKGVLQDLDLLITQKDACIQIGILPTIDGIPLQMTQLFYNLINNSLKFTREKLSPEIRISCRLLNENQKPSFLSKQVLYYEIILTDNGIGFSMEYAEQIFGLFKRLNHAQLYSGSGIGLALCRKVVENHKGQILATSKEKEGASFHIYLPERQL
jgi:signal transduction histidine kinase